MTQPQPPDRSGHPDFQPREVAPEEVGPGIYATRGFGNAGWIVTDEGVVVVDTGVAPQLGARLREAVARTTDRPVRAVIYTHGHHDHVLGAPALVEEGTEVIAHENVPERFRRYTLTRDHINRINGIQFGRDLTGRTYQYVYPTVTYHQRYELVLGGRRIELFHGKGETDDATVVHVPDARAVFAGDFLIGSFPNVGNPYKVVRYEREWYETLERVRDLRPAAVVPGHGKILREGQELEEVLRDTVEVLRFLHTETVRHINQGSTLEEAVESIRLPEHLAQSPHLAQTYSRVEFAVANIWRRYCGWYDYNPAHLLPAPRREVAAEVAALIGDDGRVLARARALHGEGRSQVALELLDLILLRREDDRPARALRAEILEALAAQDACLMSRDAYLHQLDRDRAFLAGQG